MGHNNCCGRVPFVDRIIMENDHRLIETELESVWDQIGKLISAHMGENRIDAKTGKLLSLTVHMGGGHMHMRGRPRGCTCNICSLSQWLEKCVWPYAYDTGWYAYGNPLVSSADRMHPLF